MLGVSLPVGRTRAPLAKRSQCEVSRRRARDPAIGIEHVERLRDLRGQRSDPNVIGRRQSLVEQIANPCFRFGVRVIRADQSSSPFDFSGVGAGCTG